MTHKKFPLDWLFLAVFGFLALAGCGGGTAPQGSEVKVFKLNGREYLLRAADGLATADTFLAGKGAVVFVAPLSSVGSDNGFQVEVTLDDGGSFTFIGNSDASLANGVEIRMTRTGKVLGLFARRAGEEWEDFSKKVKTVDASGKLVTALDVHNSHAHAVAAFGAVRVDMVVGGSGTGAYWGFGLDGAKVTKADVLAAPNFPE